MQPLPELEVFGEQWSLASFVSLTTLRAKSNMIFAAALRKAGGTILVRRVGPERGANDRPARRQRTPRPPDVQRRNVAVPDGLLAPRVRGDALDRQVNFDEAFGIHGLAAKRRKRRKKGKERGDQAGEFGGEVGSGRLGEGVFADFELWGAEVNEQAMFDARGAQVAKNLGGVFVGQHLGRLEFKDEAVVHVEVGEVPRQ